MTDLDLDTFEEDLGPESLAYDEPELKKFAFASKRFRIDWRRLHNIDIDKVIMHTDLDQLNGVIDVVAFGYAFFISSLAFSKIHPKRFSQDAEKISAEFLSLYCPSRRDLDAEDPLNLNEINFVRVFRLAQLIIEYLLWAQDNLHSHNKYLVTQLRFYEKYLAALRIKCREYKVRCPLLLNAESAI